MVFPGLQGCNDSNDFLKYAFSIRERYSDTPNFLLDSKDLYHVGRNHIKLIPFPANHYLALLECSLCSYRTSSLSRMQDHCYTFLHKHNLYNSEDREDMLSEDLGNESLLPRDEAFAPETSVSPKQSWEFLNQVPNKELTCEICKVSVDDQDLFHLHLTGFGHARRQQHLAELQFCFYQAFRDIRTNGMFFMRAVDNTICNEMEHNEHSILFPASFTAVSTIDCESLCEFLGSL